MSLQVGQHIAGRYRIEALLGSGGVGTVYSAIQEPLDRRVAIKTLRAELSQNPAVRRRFVREARAVAGLSHPNIAMVHDFGVAEGGQLYLAMELIEGLSLAEMVGRQALSWGVLRQIFDQVLTALAHAHARGVIHRDVKPANVLVATDVDGNPHAKLVDFGIATVQRPDQDVPGIERRAHDTNEQTDAGRWAGTPHFMAPEQARSEPHLTGAVDVYSTGVMLYWAVSGRYPFQGETPMDVLMAHCRDAVPPLVPRPGLVVPEGLDALLNDALEKEPQKRIAGASVFRARLRAMSGAAAESVDLGGGEDDITRGLNTPSGLTPQSPLPAVRPRTVFEGVGGGEGKRTLFEGAGGGEGRSTRGTRRTLLEGMRRIGATLLGGEGEAGEGGDAAGDEAGEAGETVDLGQTARPLMPLGGATGGRGGTPLLVGRDDEREAIVRAAHQVLTTSQGMILTLEGDAGVGKTRLARWAAEQLEASEGFRVAMGSFHREGERGWRGVREALEGALETGDLSEGALRDRLNALMTEYGLTSARDLELMLAFLRPTDAQDVKGGPGGDDRSRNRAQRLLALLFRLLEGISRQQPLLLVINDLHWAGPETSAFVEYLAHELTQRPTKLLLIITMQPEHHDGGAPISEMLGEISHHHGTSVQRRVLGPLTEEASKLLVTSMLQASRELVQELTQRAGGNPMHLVQLVRYLRDENLLEPSPHGWRARSGLDMAEVLPPSLVDILALRIAQLENLPGSGPRVHALLDRAAILGMRFRFSVLERMLAIENRPDLLEAIDEDIDHILDEDLLRMTELPDDDLLSFPSSLVRDVLLGRLKGRRTQRKLHIHAAEAKIAVLGANNVDSVVVELMEHFAAGRDRRREFEYACRAVDVAERSHRLSDALRLAERALRLIDASTSGTSTSPTDTTTELPADQARLQRPLLLRLARLEMIQGQYARALTHFAAIETDLSASAEERVRATFGLGKIARTRAQLTESFSHFARGVELSKSLARPDLIAYGLMGLADVETQRGHHAEARQLLSEAAPIAASIAASHPTMSAKIAWYEGELDRASGDTDAAAPHFLDALQRYQALDHRRGVADCYAKLAVIARMRADFDRAIEYYQAALRDYKTLGQRREVGHQYNGLGDIARFRGDQPLAEEHYRRAVDIFQALGLSLDAALGLTNLGLIALETFRYAEAEDALRRALKSARRIDVPYLLIGIVLNLALLLTRTKRLDEALPLLDEGLTLMDLAQMVDPDFIQPLESLADHLRDTTPDRARALYTRAANLWAELGRADDAERANARLRALPP